MNYTFAYRPKEETPLCPSCGDTVPTGGDTNVALRVNVRKGGVEFNCLLRSCYCGLELAIDQTRERNWGYAFCCKQCSSYESDLSFGGRCTRCYMRDTVGMKDPNALVAGVREAEPFITPSCQDLIDGLLTGLLRGVPGLTIEDQAA